jgi:hypothetical protein
MFTIMTDTPEERLAAHTEKSRMIRRLPLEQAVQYVNGPVYGLVEEVFGLQCTGPLLHSSRMQGGQDIDSLKLVYLSPRYEQYKGSCGWTFGVITRLAPKDVRPHFSIVRRVASDLDRGHCLIAKDASFTIEGKIFKGDVTHYTAPVRYSFFKLYHERIGLMGEAAGPSIEEFIQILESLHDLKGKAMD